MSGIRAQSATGVVVVPSPIEEPARAKGTILLAEDEVLLRFDLAEALREHGYTVIEAANADEALIVLRGSDLHIDLLLCDIRMPGTLDGLGLARVARDEFPTLKIVVASGQSVGPELRKLVDAYFFKPLNLNSLASKIKELLSAAEP